MKRLTVENLGPVARAEVELGHLTVLVGPQATGKSLLLQTVKAAADTDAIVDALRRHGYHWEEGEPSNLSELFYGEGMGGLVGQDTRIAVDGREWRFDTAAAASWSKKARRAPRVFYAPAQRVLTLQEGWPRPFTAFDIGVPFVVKQFSEDIRRLLEEGAGGEPLFPATRRWRREIRDRVDEAIFHGARVRIDPSRLRRRIVLEAGSDGGLLPFMSWSAGQREFIPLMLGLYWLMPTQGGPRRRKTELVIIEEPEMGLHPRALTTFSLLILDLVKRGYAVLLSTHSPHLLELVWALRELDGADDYPGAVGELLDLPRSMRPLAEAVRPRDIRIHYLGPIHPEGRVESRDISSLDPEDADPIVADWGGLTEFPEHAARVVARHARREGA